ncbi:MAG: alpha-L-fucosidase [Bacteroidales bacterium]|nr:alpha-L-fucosidase [Bacteroidales bacterium]
MNRISLISLAAMAMLSACTLREPEPFGPVPTEAQLAWQRMEINMFCHFGPNTFTGAEWGSGMEAEDVFHPTGLDCRQWVDVARQAGMGGIILTAKHHDGFCLWPSAFSTHTVADTLDVLRAFVDACRAGGVKPGVYISPWDRNHPSYGTDEYNDVFDNTLREVHGTYGPLFEQWFDGACGEGPNGKKQHYDWPRFMQTVNELNPQCVVFSDIGPGCRWVGNEEGHCGDPCWSTLNTEGATPSDNKPAPTELETGHKGGASWVPAEVDVSIRPGWFWHPQEHPKSVDQLMEIYFNSVGRNGLLLLNVPPDTNGRISAEDSAVLVAFRTERDRIFAHDLAQGAKAHALHRRGHGAKQVLDTAYHTYWAATSRNAELTLELDSATEFDIIVLQEYIPLGQRITSVNLLLDRDGGLYSYSLGDEPLCTTVGYKRIIRLDHPVRWRQLVFQFEGMAPPVINRIALYNSKAQ